MIYIKRLFFLLALLQSLLSFGQAKKPRVMVVPSKDWCAKNGFLRTISFDDTKEYVADWELALIKSPELNSALTKIAAEMQKSGFLLESLQKTIDGIKQERIEQSALGNLVNDPIDEVRLKASADIEIQIYWQLEKQGPRQRISNFRLEGVDTYTNKVIATAQGSGDWASAYDFSESDLLIEAVQSKMDSFKSTLQSTFDDMFVNGRDITLNIYVTEYWSENLSSEKYGDDELAFLITDWLAQNSVQGRFNSPTGNNQNRMYISGIRIPLFDKNNVALDARGYARMLKKHLTSLGISSELITIDVIGLSKVNLYIGPKK
jgi:hypothetical protein